MSLLFGSGVFLHKAPKGLYIADIKCVRALSCRKIKQVLVPLAPIWVYIRRYEDGTLKYFISNAPQETDLAVLDRLATMRWSIEQCFQECKSYLGMGHYETRSYPAWHRHMLLVMVAQHFTGVLCESFKKKAVFLTFPVAWYLVAGALCVFWFWSVRLMVVVYRYVEMLLRISRIGRKNCVSWMHANRNCKQSTTTSSDTGKQVC